MKNLLIVCALFVSTALFAQSTCDDGRFSNRNYFSAVTVTNEIEYGENTEVALFGAPNQQTLYLDIYEGTGDTMSQRPVMIVGFGGSFLTGDKSTVSSICEALAKMGYVAVAIDYRTGGFFPVDEVSTTLAVLRAAHDMKAAVRFFRKDAATANTYKIDPDRIIVGGVSAGAIAAIHAAYLDEGNEIGAYMANDTAGLGGIEGISGNPGYPSNPQAVFSFSGAIGDTAWIEENDVPIISFHETGDSVVPYGTKEVEVSGTPTGLIADGSGSLHDFCAKHGVRNFLQTYQRNGHVGYMSTEFDTTMNQVMNFMQPIACKSTTGIADRFNDTNYSLAIYPNPNYGSFTINTNVTGAYDIRVYNVLGQEVKTVTNTQGRAVSINLDEAHTGLYLVRIFEQGTNNSLQTTKFLIQ